MTEIENYLRKEILSPNWDEAGKVHDWRNHVPDAVRARWDEFSDEHKLLLHEWAEGLADAEEWD